MTKLTKGFLIGPLVPCLVFVAFAAMMGIFSVLNTGQWDNIISILFIPFVSFYWLIFALPVSYFFSLLFGIPMYLIFKHIGLFSLKSYLIGSLLAGILSGLFPELYFKDYSWTSIWIIGGGIFGAIAGFSFWTIVYGSPNNIFNRLLNRWEKNF